MIRGIDTVCAPTARHEKYKGCSCTGVNASNCSSEAARHSIEGLSDAPWGHVLMQASKRKGVTHSCQIQLGRASTQDEALHGVRGCSSCCLSCCCPASRGRRSACAQELPLKMSLIDQSDTSGISCKA